MLGERVASEPPCPVNAELVESRESNPPRLTGPEGSSGTGDRDIPDLEAPRPSPAGSAHPPERGGWHGVMLRVLRQLACHDPELRSHSERVCGLSMRIACSLGLAEERLELLRAAALLHDIGKLLIPAGILEKPGKLSLAEFREVRHHAIHGEQMLKTLPLPVAIRRFVRAHHERYNGKGYPDHLSGEEIPLESRILGLADAYDAMTADRPYHAGMGGRAACRRIQRLSGVHFDPRVVASFLPLPAGGVEFLPRGAPFAAPAALEA